MSAVDTDTKLQVHDSSRISVSPPTGMPNVLGLVIGREIRSRAFNRAFVFSALFTIALVLAGIIIPTLVGGGPTTYNVGIVGPGNTDITAAAERLANVGAEEGEATTIEVTDYADTEAAERAVRDGDIDAALVDGQGVVVNRAGGFSSSTLMELLQQAAGVQQIDASIGAEQATQVETALSGEALEVASLSGQDEQVTQGRTVLAYGGLLLTYMLILQFGMWTLTGVTEEKANRVMEILLSSARPWQLFAGKVIGVGLLGLAQFAVTIAAALVAIRVTGAFDLPSVPIGFAAMLGVWVIVGYAIYLVLFGAAGALAAKMEDAQSSVSPITLLILSGFLMSFVVLADPDGTTALVGTFLPPFAPFIVPIRFALNAIPVWQQLLSVALSIGAVVGLTILSGRVYRGGVLQFANKISWRQAFQSE